MEVDDALTDEIMQMTTDDINFRTQMLGKKVPRSNVDSPKYITRSEWLICESYFLKLHILGIFEFFFR